MRRMLLVLLFPLFLLDLVVAADISTSPLISTPAKVSRDTKAAYKKQEDEELKCAHSTDQDHDGEMSVCERSMKDSIQDAFESVSVTNTSHSFDIKEEDWQHQMLLLLKTYLQAGDLFIDIGVEEAQSIELLRHVHPNGAGIFMMKDLDGYTTFSRTLHSMGLFTNAIVSTSGRDFYDVTEILALVSHKCPKLIQISNFDTFLFYRSDLLNECRTVILFANNVPDYSKALLKLFEHENFQLYWLIFNGFDSRTKEIYSVYYVLAIPSELVNELSSWLATLDLMIPFQDSMYLIEEYNICLSFEQSSNFRELLQPIQLQDCVIGSDTMNKQLQQVQPPPNDPQNHKLRNSLIKSIFNDDHKLEFRVYPRDILPPSHSNYTDECLKSQFFLFKYYQHCSRRTVAEYSADLCSSFGHLSYQNPHINPQDLQQKCVEFCAHRYKMLQESFDENPNNNISNSHISNTTNISGSFNLQNLSHYPFDFSYDPEVCAEPIWCNHMNEFQRRLNQWQSPSLTANNRKSCNSAKFLVYEPDTPVHGIGSILTQVAHMFRLALCLGRIFYLNNRDLMPTHARWRHPGCLGSMIECYFEPVTECVLSDSELNNSPVVRRGSLLDKAPYKYERILRIHKPTTEGVCSLCGSAWTGSTEFFDGLHIGELGFTTSADANGNLDPTIFEILDPESRHLGHFYAYLSPVKLPWLSQFMRYLLRPRQWFREAVKDIVSLRLNTDSLPPVYASLHIRHGEKIREVERISLVGYMKLLKKKAPYIEHIFVSTETEEVIKNLTLSFPEYKFYYLQYHRYEYVHSVDQSRIQFADDFIFSMANLFVSIRAEYFLGTLSSSWCQLINMMQRTRGDGGHDYDSIDNGSQFTVCF